MRWLLEFIRQVRYWETRKAIHEANKRVLWPR